MDQVAETWLAMLDPAVRLRAASPRGAGGPLWQLRHRGRDHAAPRAAGWLGCLPPLPVALSQWPSWEGHGPLAHVATLACAGLQSVLPARLRATGFPADGWLSFFYFDGSADGGAEVVGSLFAGTAAGARVLYTPPGHEGVARAPAGISSYPKVELAAETVLTWATWEHPRIHCRPRRRYRAPRRGS